MNMTRVWFPRGRGVAYAFNDGEYNTAANTDDILKRWVSVTLDSEDTKESMPVSMRKMHTLSSRADGRNVDASFTQHQA